MQAKLNARFKKVEHGNAVFNLADGQELKVTKELLNPLPAEGTEFILTLLPEAEAVLEQEKLAKVLLNQILKDE